MPADVACGVCTQPQAHEHKPEANGPMLQMRVIEACNENARPVAHFDYCEDEEGETRDEEAWSAKITRERGGFCE
jgi:hypothetical protein